MVTDHTFANVATSEPLQAFDVEPPPASLSTFLVMRVLQASVSPVRLREHKQESKEFRLQTRHFAAFQYMKEPNFSLQATLSRQS